MELASRYLGPPLRGVEIGASAINPFPGLDSWNLDYPGGELFQAAQERIAGQAATLDVLGFGDPLPFRDGSLDYLLTSHVLEHMPDTIATLVEWSRVVKDGGTLFLIVPHRARTFDAARPRTPLQHHLADFAVGMTIESSAMVPTSHYHVWETADLLALVDELNTAGLLDWEWLEVEDVDSKVGNGFTLVARKRSQPARVPEAPIARGAPIARVAPDRPVAFHQLTLALPFQIAGRTIEHTLPGAGPMLGPEQLMSLGLPRGRYRAVPILEGFPPVAGEASLVDVGPPQAAPAIENVTRRGSRLSFEGRDLGESTWLEVELPDGRVVPLFPDWAAGRLEVDLDGLVVPEVEVALRAVNPPPGGGPGPAYPLREHLTP